MLTGYAAEFDAVLAALRAAPAPLPVPKLADFDERAGLFVLDERQQGKQPDWTYRLPHAPPPGRTRPASAPSDRPHVGVPIAAELMARLRTRAERDYVPAEQLIEQALEEWLRR